VRLAVVIFHAILVDSLLFVDSIILGSSHYCTPIVWNASSAN